MPVAETDARPCFECGYDLRVHPLEAPCPECGTAFLSGPVELRGVEQGMAAAAPGTATVKLLLIAGAFGVVAALARVNLKTSEDNVTLYYLLPVFAILALLVPVFRRWRKPHQVLRLDEAGITLRKERTGRVLFEPWSRQMKFSIPRPMKTLPTDLEPQVQIRVDAGEPLLRFTAEMSAGKAKAIENQVQVWLAEALPVLDPLRPYRSCANCLRSGCGCPPSDTDLYLVPMYSPFQWSEGAGLSALGIFGGSMGTIVRMPPWDALQLAMLVAIVFNASCLRRTNRDTPGMEARFSPIGYQYCQPGAPLNLKPWQHLQLQTRLQSFGKISFWLSTPRVLTLVPSKRVGVLPQVTAGALRTTQHAWAESSRRANGFSIE